MGEGSTFRYGKILYLLLALMLMACTLIDNLMQGIIPTDRPGEREPSASSTSESFPTSPDTTPITGGDRDEHVILDINWRRDPTTADPALAFDTISIDLVGQLFMGLTRFDPASGQVLPFLATQWQVSPDGLIYTFTLRPDVPWVQYDGRTGEVDLVRDSLGEVRYVTAADVEYGVKRTINPDTDSDYAYVLYIIKNAQSVNEGEAGLTLADVGVRAVDETTIEFELESPAGFFPAIGGMWVTFATPGWLIEAEGDRWTQPGLLVSNGPFVMTEWIHDSELNLARNPYWPMADQVQIDEVRGRVIEDAYAALAFYENNELDTVPVPGGELERVRADPVLSNEYVNRPELCTYYYGFTNNKPPFDDARVRRAFSLSVDKNFLVENILAGGLLPAGQFAPPGIFGAPQPGSIGLPYDPDAAMALLQDYLDDKDMTLTQFNDMGITLMTSTSSGRSSPVADAVQQMWRDALGVEVGIEIEEWTLYRNTLRNSTPLENMPHIWWETWCADYPDENNWVYERFNSLSGANQTRRGCLDDVCTQVVPSEFDEITEQAKAEADPVVRIELYFEAERLLSEVEVAYIPLFFYAQGIVTKPWLRRDYPALGAINLWEWEIDWDAKEDAIR